MIKKLSKREKTLLTLFNITNGKKKSVHYEDLLVETFKAYKKDFQLKRYPKFPDSDVFRYIIYFQLKPAGLIRIVNKQCILTDLGIKLSKELSGSDKGESFNKVITNQEIHRLENLEGFKMFIEKKLNEIIDQDFYDFFKSSVRTKPLELLGNIEQIKGIINDYSKTNKKLSNLLNEYSNFLKKKFFHIYDGIKNEGSN